jgi:hypothetical protein
MLNNDQKEIETITEESRISIVAFDGKIGLII